MNENERSASAAAWENANEPEHKTFPLLRLWNPDWFCLIMLVYVHSHTANNSSGALNATLFASQVKSDASFHIKKS